MEKTKKDLHILQTLETAMLIGMLYVASFIVLTAFMI